MTRLYDDPVDVRRHDEAPTEFLWRGRLYVVRDVLAHWVETGAWWRAPAARAVYGVSPSASPPASSSAGGAGSLQDTADQRSSDDEEPSPSGIAVDDAERELWRVEASSGRMRGSGVFDLCFDWSAGAWSLARALD